MYYCNLAKCASFNYYKVVNKHSIASNFLKNGDHFNAPYTVIIYAHLILCYHNNSLHKDALHELRKTTGV